MKKILFVKQRPVVAVPRPPVDVRVAPGFPRVQSGWVMCPPPPPKAPPPPPPLSGHAASLTPY